MKLITLAFEFIFRTPIYKGPAIVTILNKESLTIDVGKNPTIMDL